MKNTIRLALVAALAALSAPAFAAGTTPASFTVTATVAAKCFVSSGTNLAFNAYDPSLPTNSVTGTSTITFFCTKTTPWKVTLSTGNNPGKGTGATTRAMASASGDFLSYDLYTTGTYTAANVWSNVTTGNVASGTGTGGATPDTVTVYGAIPGGQYVTPANDYSDTISYVINY